MAEHINYPKFRKNKVDLFGRCSNILSDLQQLFPETQVDWQQMTKWLAIARRMYEAEKFSAKNGIQPHLHYGRRNVKSNWHRVRPLSPVERMVYQYLQTTKRLEYQGKDGNTKRYSISTVYRWVIACRIPQDLMEAYNKKEINQTEAIKRARVRLGKQTQKVEEAKLIIEMTIEIVERIAQTIDESDCDDYLNELEGGCAV